MRRPISRGQGVAAAVSLAALALGSLACTLDTSGLARSTPGAPDGGGGGTGGGGEVAACDPEKDFEDPATHHCYRHIETQKTWHDARIDCQALGGDLVAISTPEERDFLASKLDESVWSGGTSTDLALCFYSWTNGEPWAPFWAGGEPNRQGNEACVEVREDARFNDLECWHLLGYLCERVPPGECGDGIVQGGEECESGMPIAGATCDGCKVRCDTGELKDPENLHCYRLNAGYKSWDGGRQACQSAGGHLATLTTWSEARLMSGNLITDTWIGGSADGNGVWSWVTGEPWCFQNWQDGEPSSGSQSSLEMYSGSGKWNNDDSSEFDHYLCERAPLGND